MIHAMYMSVTSLPVQASGTKILDATEVAQMSRGLGVRAFEISVQDPQIMQGLTKGMQSIKAPLTSLRSILAMSKAPRTPKAFSP